MGACMHGRMSGSIRDMGRRMSAWMGARMDVCIWGVIVIIIIIRIIIIIIIVILIIIIIIIIMIIIIARASLYIHPTFCIFL